MRGLGERDYGMILDNMDYGLGGNYNGYGLYQKEMITDFTDLTDAGTGRTGLRNDS